MIVIMLAISWLLVFILSHRLIHTASLLKQNTKLLALWMQEDDERFKAHYKQAASGDILTLIEDWRETFKIPVRNELTVPSKEEITLALSLIQEELDELKAASEAKDIIEVADAIGDLYFVVTQAANIWGIPIKAVVKEVYDSNMSKICYDMEEAIGRLDCSSDPVLINGKEGWILKRISDGKVQKPSTFIEPDLKTVLGL